MFVIFVEAYGILRWVAMVMFDELSMQSMCQQANMT
jgi:hypothetical protein